MYGSLLASSAFRNEYCDAIPVTSMCTLWRAGRSELLRVSVPKVASVFSCPGEAVDGGEGEGVYDTLVASGAALKARFRGLLGETRALASGREGEAVFADLAERSDSRTFVRCGVNEDWCEVDACAEVTAGGAVCGCEGARCGRCGVGPKRRQGDCGEAC